jgi:hypothetical protein
MKAERPEAGGMVKASQSGEHRACARRVVESGLTAKVNHFKFKTSSAM